MFPPQFKYFKGFNWGKLIIFKGKSIIFWIKKFKNKKNFPQFIKKGVILKNFTIPGEYKNVFYMENYTVPGRVK